MALALGMPLAEECLSLTAKSAGKKVRAKKKPPADAGGFCLLLPSLE